MTGYIDVLEITADGVFLVVGHSGVPGMGNRTAVYTIATGARTWRLLAEGDIQGVHVVADKPV